MTIPRYQIGAMYSRETEPDLIALQAEDWFLQCRGDLHDWLGECVTGDWSLTCSPVVYEGGKEPGKESGMWAIHLLYTSEADVLLHKLRWL